MDHVRVHSTGEELPRPSWPELHRCADILMSPSSEGLVYFARSRIEYPDRPGVVCRSSRTMGSEEGGGGR